MGSLAVLFALLIGFVLMSYKSQGAVVTIQQSSQQSEHLPDTADSGDRKFASIWRSPVFVQSAAILLSTGLARTSLDTIIPLHVSADFHESAVTAGTVFSVGAALG